MDSFDGTCHAYVEGISTPYDYTPSLAAGITFCTLFGLSVLLHTFQALYGRKWWCLVFAIGCISKYSSEPPFSQQFHDEKETLYLEAD